MAKRLKKQKGNIDMDKPRRSAKLSLLNTHSSLIFAVSQENRVNECLLKLAIERINATTALMQWAKMESNIALGDAICSIYQINLMWSSIQKEFVKESKLFGLCLSEILQVEEELDAIRMQVKEKTEKKEKLTKLIDSQNRKKLESLKAIEELEKEIVEAKSELEARTLKAEVDKNAMLKKSLLSLMKSHLKLASDSRYIFLTAIKIVEKIPDMPIHLQDPEKIKEHQTGFCNSDEIQKLAKKIKLDSTPMRDINDQQSLPNQNKTLKSNENLSNYSSNDSEIIVRKKRSQTATEPLVSLPDYNCSSSPKSSIGTEPESDLYVKPNCSTLCRSSTFPKESKPGAVKLSADCDDENETSSYYLFDFDNEPIYDEPLQSDDNSPRMSPIFLKSEHKEKQIKTSSNCQLNEENYLRFPSREDESSDVYSYDSPEDDNLYDSIEEKSNTLYTRLKKKVKSKKDIIISEVSLSSVKKEESPEKCDYSVSQLGYVESPEGSSRLLNASYKFTSPTTENNNNNSDSIKTDVNESSTISKKKPLPLPRSRLSAKI